MTRLSRLSGLREDLEEAEWAFERISLIEPASDQEAEIRRMAMDDIRSRIKEIKYEIADLEGWEHG